MVMLALSASYLWGALSPAYLITRAVRGIDLREYGSGNVGLEANRLPLPSDARARRAILWRRFWWDRDVPLDQSWETRGRIFDSERKGL